MVRFKKRYFVIEVEPEQPIRFPWNALQNAIVEAIRRLHGDFGVAATSLGFHVKYCNSETGMAFVSTGRGPHQLVATALPLVTQVGGRGATLRTVYVAASMRRGFIFVKKYHEEKLREMEAHLTPAQKVLWKEEKVRAKR